jgi:uncharacterized protein (TIGR02680 family)
MTSNATINPNSAHRFRPSRVGIIGMYQFEDQVFEFADGKMLLRGHNGSGKSKALELTVPLLLHGDLRPEYLDPFGSTSRTMRWNLLGDGASAAQSAIGYAWIEFERVDEHGTSHWVTGILGCRATQASHEVKSWFATVSASRTADGQLTGKRVGDGLQLRNGRTPLTRDRLPAAVGDAGEVVDQSSRYREQLNQLLFGFSSERYDGMFQLVKSLRKPQLSKTLDPEELSERLSDALAEIERTDVLRVSQRLEELDRLRRDLDEMVSVEQEVRRFRDTYSAYAAATVSERYEQFVNACDVLAARQRDLKEAQGRYEAAARSQTELEQQLSTVAKSIADAEGAETELRSSAGMQAAEALERQRVEAEAAQATHRRLTAQYQAAEQQLHELRAALSDAQLHAQRTARTVTQSGAALLAAAETAGIHTHEAAVSGIEDRDLDALRDTLVNELARTRIDAIDAQLRLAVSLQKLDSQVDDARLYAEEAQSEQQQHLDELREAEREIAGCQQDLREQVSEWTQRLQALPLNDDGKRKVCQVAEGDFAQARMLVERLAERAADSVRDQRADCRQQHRAAEREVARLTQQRDEAAQAQPHTTAAFWRHVDFRADLDERQRDGIEAALRAAGLLDAAVGGDSTPAWAQTPAAAGSRTLADALVPAAGGEVFERRIRELLASVAWVDDWSADESSAAVSCDGRFRLGVLVGQAEIRTATHIGSQAHERQIRELNVSLADAQTRERQLRAQCVQLDEQLRILAAERAAFPSDRPLAKAQVRAQIAAQQERSARERAGELQARVARSENDASRRRQTILDHTHQHQLPTNVDELRELRGACETYQRQVPDLIAAERERRHAVRRLDQEQQHLERERQRVSDIEDQLTEAQTNAHRTAGAWRTAQDSSGADAEALRVNLQSTVSRLRDLRAEHERMLRRAADLARTAERANSAVAVAQERADAATEQRDQAFARLRMLEDIDFLRLAYGPVHEHDWTVESTLAAFADLPSTAGRRTATLVDDVDRTCDQLRTVIGGAAGYQVARERDRHSQELTIVKITHQGQTKPITDLLAWLEDEIDTRRRTIDHEDRQVFTDFLVGGLAESLRDRIVAADQLVSGVNEALLECQTMSGMQIQLQWSPRDQEDPALYEVITLLHRDFSGLTDEQRGILIDFLRRRIEDAREANLQGSTVDHIMRALDYRTWHEFRVFRIQHGVREQLTKKKHQQGSGGEKAIALHLPLFAAAAAQFDAAGDSAPRLIALDEAYAGIDDSNRAQLMALTERFDLDYLITSYDMWGCYPEVSTLSIYDLSRDSQAPGVMAVHFIWDGSGKALAGEAAASTDRPTVR